MLLQLGVRILYLFPFKFIKQRMEAVLFPACLLCVLHGSELKTHNHETNVMWVVNNTSGRTERGLSVILDRGNAVKNVVFFVFFRVNEAEDHFGLLIRFRQMCSR